MTRAWGSWWNYNAGFVLVFVMFCAVLAGAVWSEGQKKREQTAERNSREQMIATVARQAETIEHLEQRLRACGCVK